MDRLEVVDDSAKQKNATTVVNWNYKLETIIVIHENTGSLEDQSFSLAEGGEFTIPGGFSSPVKPYVQVI
jgi:hypothetical protein